MSISKELLYTKTHEWAKKENETKVKIGISDHAQHEITDVVHVELPSIGKTFEAGQPCAVVESVKAAFDIYAPISGKIVQINEKLSSNPELVNQSPYEQGYFFVIEPSNSKELNNLLSAKDYEKLLESNE